MMVLSFDETLEFQKDLKRLAKKWRSLPQDIKDVKLQINALYGAVLTGDELTEFRDRFFGTKRAAILTSGDGYEVVKMRLDCASLGNDKKTRLVFVAIVRESRVILIELYAKSSNEREDPRRIKKYLP